MDVIPSKRLDNAIRVRPFDKVFVRFSRIRILFCITKLNQHTHSIQHYEYYVIIQLLLCSRSIINYLIIIFFLNKMF